MLVIKIWNYFQGYVIIRIEGLTLEKFLNLAVTKDIYLWDINRIGYTTIEAKVRTNGFKLLKEIVKNVGCRVNIVEKKGFPFLLNRLKSRKMFAIGFVIFIGLIFFLTSLIWNIEVLGNDKVSSESILSLMDEIDVKEGIIKYRVDTSLVKNMLLDKVDYFSFVNVEIKGTKLIVEVKERDLPPEIVTKDTPCNIVAKKKGVIEKIIARNGKSVVEKGDIVRKGQLLITGIIADEMLDKNILVHSDGEVLAITRYSEIVEEPIEKMLKKETGNVYTTRELKIGDKGISIVKGEIPFENYIEEEKAKKIIDSKLIKLPIQIVNHEFKEVEIIRVKQNIDAIKKSTQVFAIQKINNNLSKDAKIISKDVKYDISDNKLITEVVIEVIEDIGEKQIIYNRED
jgi:similar to stage IV sporulation protein